MPATTYLRLHDYAYGAARRIAAWWPASGVDLLLTPTAAEPPPPLGRFDPTADNPLAGFARAAPFSTITSPFNVMGQPAISLPLYWTGTGVLVGVQLGAAYGREDLLLRVASQLETAQPWADRWPPIRA